ncbi:MAG: D-alanine--D-alanine ligase family protein [Candidatus Roseilinea sp.]|uniref:D-alanine--D-alanine ligase family protein n=1 Tax=Candidatus Roseilinea sp. TaxID=2838777 RepID=UPI00404A800B
MTQDTTSRQPKIKLAVLYGGQSGEHEVSLMSAASVIEALDKNRYDVTPVLIGRDGRWPVPLESLRQFDAVFPVLHGPNGEDGTVQGLLRLLGVPFVGADVVGSAVGMDKAIFKDVMRAHGLPVVRAMVVLRHEWHSRAEAILTQAMMALGLPVFVKPANMGSSVGISKCKSVEEVAAGVVEALQWDRKVLIEAAVPNARELEVSVLGNEEQRASIVGEIKPRREFYDYAAKYLATGDEKSELLIPAPISDALASRVRDMAVEVTRATDIQGMARVDFLMNGQTGEVFVNEVNTIPGFTAISMYPKLWVATGMSYPALLDCLIQLALDRAQMTDDR